MARTRRTSEVKTEAYRHTGDKRKNIPSAKIASEGKIPQVKKARYYYSPHLSPELRFDPTGEADRMLSVAEAAKEYATGTYKAKLEAAIQKNQPWLEWAGKKEEYDRRFFDVDPVALHIHERVSAQAIVRTAMREDAQRDLFADPQLPYQKEIQFYQHDIDWANRLILGDSLQVMSSLARRENLAGKVQMIYIDPPYGVSFSSNFQPRVGSRDVKEKEDDLIRELEMVKAYRDTWKLGVHSYISYLRDRLILCQELLSDSGNIFIQIGDDNLHRVRQLLEEVFGPENFVAIINYRSMTPLGQKGLARVYDYIIWYAKNVNKAKFRPLYVPKDISNDNEYCYVAEPGGGHSKLTHEEKAKTDSPKGIFKRSVLTSSRYTKSCTFAFDFQGKQVKPLSGKSWRTNPEGMRRLVSADRLLMLGNNPYFRQYHGDFGREQLENSWHDTAAGFSEPKVYVVQTNEKVIERCLLMTTDPGDLVLDPTCGSGTTGYVSEKWGRRWITIDTSRVSIALARQRYLTRTFDFYKLRGTRISEGLEYRHAPHIELGRDIGQNRNLDPIFAKHEPLLDAALIACNGSLAQVPDSVRDKCSQKLLEKKAREGTRAISNADRRRWELPKKGEKWEHWEIPFDTDRDWPRNLQDSVAVYRRTWQLKMDEVNACIAVNAKQEELIDQPEVVHGIVRVSGPFTVEGVRPEEMSLATEGLFEGSPAAGEEEGLPDIRDDVQNLRAYLSRMVELIRKDGVTFTGNNFRKFARVTALYEEKSCATIHAAGIWEGTDASEPDSVAIAFGPQYGPVTAQQVEDIIRASKRYDELVIAGFSFDGEAAVAIQEASHPTLKIHMAHVRPDVSPGMDGLLKDTPNSQLFSVFGQPEIKVKKHGKEEYEVELLGVDIFDPLKGEVRSTGAEKVAAWFLDSDYDGRCFCITQAFFPDQSAWAKIAKALGSQADEDAFAAFAGTVSLPFKEGKYKRVAIKVIDPRGNEVMAFQKLED